MEKQTELRLYAVRDTSTGKLVSDLTNPKKKFWQRKNAAEEAMRGVGSVASYRYGRYKSLELVTFRLVEVTEDEQRKAD